MTEEKKSQVSLAKSLLLEEIQREFHSSPNAFFSRFDRLSVADMSELRHSLRKLSRRTLVVKHSLAKKVFEKANVGEAARFLEGSVLLTLGAGEPQLASKALVEFGKGRDHFELKGMVLDGKVYDSDFIRALAKLPPRKDLLAALAVRMKSPLVGFVMTLRGLLRSLAVMLNEIHKKKSQGGP